MGQHMSMNADRNSALRAVDSPVYQEPSTAPASVSNSDCDTRAAALRWWKSAAPNSALTVSRLAEPRCSRSS